jgi:bifunctional DNase/RNase
MEVEMKNPGPDDGSGHQHADRDPARRSGDAILPIWVGIYEANAIALEIEKVTTPRPMTHDLIKNVLFGLEAGAKRWW